MGRFVPRTEQEVRALFARLGFTEEHIPGTYEIVFERVIDKTPGLKIRAYTTVARGEVRKCGSDAGRVCLVDRETGRIVWEAKKVLRTASFLDNMAERCREAWKAVSKLQWCPICSGPMVARKRGGEKEPSFYGCVRYPGCRGTRPMKK